MAAVLSQRKIDRYRSKTFRWSAKDRVRTLDEAVAFVRQRGYVFFWPIEGVLLPSLWCAVAGDRPVPNDHDDPGHITWRWKDEMLGKRVWYYAKALRKRATLIALDVAPFFYALTENYGAPEEDYQLQYEQGRMRLEEKLVFEALLREGPLDSLALRRAAHLASRESEYRFSRALTDLQAGFKILPVGVANVGAWGYAFIYDLVHRHIPELLEQARWIGEKQARRELARRYLEMLGAAQPASLEKLFGWTRAETRVAIEYLAGEGIVRSNMPMEGLAGEWIVHRDLIDKAG